MNVIDPDRCAVVLVDFQQRLMPAINRAAEVLDEAICLADVACELGLLVVGTEQNPRGLGPTVAAIRKRCAATLPKSHFDACADGLIELLRQGSADVTPIDVVIAGCEAHVCLMQTSLGLLRAGHRVWVVALACGSRTADDHQLAMQRLRHSGAHIVSLEMVAFEWLRSCTHDRFKPVLQLIKARGASAGRAFQG